jgi:hypothetical protein
MDEKEFYKNLKLFLKELIVVFPEDDDDLYTIITSVNIAILEDSENKIIKKFYNAMSPLEHRINTRNILIFEEIRWEPSSYEYHLFYRLKNQWNLFTDINKSIIWDYIQVLYGLSKRSIC